MTMQRRGFGQSSFFSNKTFGSFQPTEFMNFQLKKRLGTCMVVFLDDSSEHGAHIWNKSGISIVQGIWLHRKSRQIRFFFFHKIPILIHICAQHVLSYHLIQLPHGLTLEINDTFKEFWLHECTPICDVKPGLKTLLMPSPVYNFTIDNSQTPSFFVFRTVFQIQMIKIN